MARHRASLDNFWLKGESLEDSENLPPRWVIEAEIVGDVESALKQMRLIADDVGDKRLVSEDSGTSASLS